MEVEGDGDGPVLAPDMNDCDLPGLGAMCLVVGGDVERVNGN